MLDKYDLIIVGAGLYGPFFAEQAKSRGQKVLVLEKRDHIAGNVYTKEVDKIHVHKYGAHIFHTSNEEVWQYVQKFAGMRPFVNSPLASFEDKFYNLPFNMNTFYQLWGVLTPEEAKNKIESQRLKLDREAKNLEEQALSLVGHDIYEKLIKGYTEKQWGQKCRDLPAFIIRRLPLRFSFDNNYFNDRYQAIPDEGYTTMVAKMLEGVELRLGLDFMANKDFWLTKAKKIVFTGAIDAFYSYELGPLSYRSLRFEEKKIASENVQGNAVINYTSSEIPYTRVIEHRHFMGALDTPFSILSYEYPEDWDINKEAYYPIENEANKALYQTYLELAGQRNPEVLFGGRLGLYRYFNMDQIILRALEDFRRGLH